MSEKHQCDRCDSQEIFLRKKGNATGLYCKECGRWYKWVGKKDVKAYTHRGFKVHPESYEPNLQPSSQPVGVPYDSTQHGNQNNTIVPNRLGVARPSRPTHTELEDEDDSLNFEVSEEEIQSHNALTGNRPSQHDNYYDDEDDIETETEDYDNPSPIKESKLTCPTCATGIIESLSQSDDISFSISRGTVRVMNKNKTKILGAFALSHCPTCGELT